MTKSNNNSKTVVIKDVELNWAFLTKSHAPFGQEIWDVQVKTTDQAIVDQMKDAGVNMKEKDGAFVANVKRKVMNAKGERNNPPQLIDSEGNAMDNNPGNGSKGNVKLFSYEYNVGGRSGRAAMLSAVRVTDLVEYNATTEELDF